MVSLLSSSLSGCGGTATITSILVNSLRLTREYGREYGNSKSKFVIKQHVCEVALGSILKLDRAERQDEPAPDVEPTDDPALESPPYRSSPPGGGPSPSRA